MVSVLGVVRVVSVLAGGIQLRIASTHEDGERSHGGQSDSEWQRVALNGFEGGTRDWDGRSY